MKTPAVTAAAALALALSGGAALGQAGLGQIVTEPLPAPKPAGQPEAAMAQPAAVEPSGEPDPAAPAAEPAARPAGPAAQPTATGQTPEPAARPAAPAGQPSETGQATGAASRPSAPAGQLNATGQPAEPFVQPFVAPGPAAAPAAGEIIAPGTVDAGQVVNVIVNGAPQGTTMELWGPVTQTGGGDRLSTAPLVGGIARLDAPEQTGSYQLRYLGLDGRTRARAPFDVAAVPIALSVMTPAQPGGGLDVRWQGPASPGDRFEIVGPTGALVDATPVAGDASSENASTLTAPGEPGAYQLRYVSGRGAVLRAVGFEVR